MKDIEYWRREIDRVDLEMVRLFQERMNIVEGIARFKQANHMKIVDEGREKEVISKNLLRIEDEKLKKYYRQFLINVMEVSKEYQKDILGLGERVGYQGVEGAFSYIAMKKIFKNLESKSFETFENVFQGVESGKLKYGIIPIENSYTGEIGEVFDLLKKYDCHVVKTYDLKINQNLLGVRGSTIKDLKEIYSHPQGFLQSERFLKERGWKHIDYGNTAASAKYISEVGDKSKAAIGSIETAEIYDLDVLAENINTTDNNCTKFIVISREELKAGDTFSLLIAAEHQAGALAGVIKLIEKYGYNMLNIKSRPIKDVPWEYYFYIELEGNLMEAEELIRELKVESKYLKVLGSYERQGEER